jgi:hypothetical protein
MLVPILVQALGPSATPPPPSPAIPPPPTAGPLHRTHSVVFPFPRPHWPPAPWLRGVVAKLGSIAGRERSAPLGPKPPELAAACRRRIATLAWAAILASLPTGRWPFTGRETHNQHGEEA